MLGGAGRVLARDLLKSTQLSCEVRGRRATGRCVHELLHAHALVLNTAQQSVSTDNHQWVHEFAVGLVVLTNDLQRVSLSEQWLRKTHQGVVQRFRAGMSGCDRCTGRAEQSPSAGATRNAELTDVVTRRSRVHWGILSRWVGTGSTVRCFQLVPTSWCPP
jgi:hypothetical protein